MRKLNALAISVTAVLLVGANTPIVSAQNPTPPPTPEQRLEALEEFKDWFHQSHKEPQQKVIDALVRAVDTLQKDIKQKADDIIALRKELNALQQKVSQKTDDGMMDLRKEVKALKDRVGQKTDDILALKKAVEAIQVKVGK